MISLLKEELQIFKEQSVLQLSEPQVDRLLDMMLDNIGHVDPSVRDDLIYPLFIRLIDELHLSHRQTLYVLKRCVDEKHLLYRLGEKDTDSVFTRSFSSLVIAAIINQDAIQLSLSRDIIKETVDISIQYLIGEQDTRGHVGKKGWAHSIAHGADMMTALIKHPKFPDRQATKVLHALNNCLFKEATYVDDEDERLIYIVEALLNRESSLSITDWIDAIFADLEQIHQNDVDRFFKTKFNVTLFFKTLYFRLKSHDKFGTTQNQITEHLQRVHQKIYGQS